MGSRGSGTVGLTNFLASSVACRRCWARRGGHEVVRVGVEGLRIRYCMCPTWNRLVATLLVVSFCRELDFEQSFHEVEVLP